MSKMEYRAEPNASFILFIVFLILKLTGVIAWSWVWVTAPLWIGFALFLVLLMLFGIVVWVLNRRDTRRYNKRRRNR